MHEARRKRESGTREESAAGAKAQGVPGDQVIAWFLLFWLFLSAGWGSLIALVRVALGFVLRNPIRAADVPSKLLSLHSKYF